MEPAKHDRTRLAAAAACMSGCVLFTAEVETTEIHRHEPIGDAVLYPILTVAASGVDAGVIEVGGEKVQPVRIVSGIDTTVEWDAQWGAITGTVIDEGASNPGFACALFPFALVGDLLMTPCSLVWASCKALAAPGSNVVTSEGVDHEPLPAPRFVQPRDPATGATVKVGWDGAGRAAFDVARTFKLPEALASGLEDAAVREQERLGAVIRVAPGDDLRGVISSAPDDALILLEAGDYVVERQLQLRRRVEIRGAGMDRTRIVGKCDAPLVRVPEPLSSVTLGVVFNTATPPGLRILRGLTLRHEGPDGWGVLSCVRDCLLDDVRLTRARSKPSTEAGGGVIGGHGAYAYGGSFEARHCVIEGNAERGIIASDLERFVLVDCLVTKNTLGGAELQGAKVATDARIAGCVFRENLEFELVVGGSVRAAVRSSEFSNGASSAIAALGATATLLDNSIDGFAKGFGVLATGSASVEASGNDKDAIVVNEGNRMVRDDDDGSP
ncbi:MAG: right-handed parallel beta-helix repeat-containing protein [Planctomycetes bacterium]|nr:right-handed parallel beta-helix repeat-containing protein [Planctomycetota bacterium]